MRTRRRRFVSALALSLVVSMLPQWDPPAVAAPPRQRPAGASDTAPNQNAGKAGNRPATVGADATKSAKDGTPSGPPANPRGVGLEVRHPEPALPGTGPQRLTTLSAGTAAATGYVEGQSRELPAERKARSTVYQNPDGTRTLRSYTHDAFVPGHRGDYVPADNRLMVRTDGRVEPIAGPRVTIAARADDPSLVTAGLGDGVEVGFALDGAAASPGELDGNAATFRGVRSRSDLVLTSGPKALKEDIVLHSAGAPTTWTFPLRARGLTPELRDTGEVVFKDAKGTVRAMIPRGYMVDSKINPNSGTGVKSHGVKYQLIGSEGNWALRVDLDAAWLRDPKRVFPVTVDPTLRLKINSSDLFVSTAPYYADSWNSADPILAAGTVAEGYIIADERGEYASYIQIPLWGELNYKYVLGASINIFNHWSASCTPQPFGVYTMREEIPPVGPPHWPGFAYDAANPLTTAPLTGYGCASRPENWQKIQIPAMRVTNWLHGYDHPFYGFTLRAPANTKAAGKHFYSADSFTVVTGAEPFVDIVYAVEGAEYSLPNPTFNPPVTVTSAGKITARAKNWSEHTWTPTNGYRLVSIVRNASGTEVSRKTYTMPSEVQRNWTVDVPVDVGPLPVGNYSLQFDMLDPAGRSFQAYHGVPASAPVGFSVANGPPVPVAKYPEHNGYVDTLQPSLWVDYQDPDNYPAGAQRRYKYEICNGTPEAPTGCQNSGWTTNPAWQVPAGALFWSKSTFWYVTLSDTASESPKYGPFFFTPVVAQPAVTSHLAGAADEGDTPGLNPQVGNYSTAVLDASVNVPGPPLSVQRTYNSQDLRTSGAFGAGWASPLDQRLVSEPSGNVVVTLASGRTVRFGLNPDVSFAPPPGQQLNLVFNGAALTWTMRDNTGTQRVFDAQGRLTLVVDWDGRQQQLTYSGTSARPTQIRDVTSGRSLWPTWENNHVTAVATDPPAAGQPAPTWRYTYTGDLLTKVCSPLSTQSCTSYEYAASSHYRSVVLDDNPYGYWPLGETSGSELANVAARSPGERGAAGTGITLAQSGALAGTPDTSVKFSGTTASRVALPNNLLNSSVAYAIELWFKVDSGKSGVLFGEQNTDVPATPNNWTPTLVVGTDGKLRGYSWTVAGAVNLQITTPGRVDNGQWHHVVLSVAVTTQEMYLDGAKVGQYTGNVVDHINMNRFYLGVAYANAWPNAVAGNFPFTGQIDEAAVYKHPLSATQIAAHYAARSQSNRLSKVIEPGGFAAATMTYEHAAGRVTTMADRHGATWTIGAPVVGDRTRSVTVSSTARDAVVYTYDADRNGRLTKRTDTFGTRLWEYDANGFVWRYVNENGHSRFYSHDERGNVIAEIVWYRNSFRYRYFAYFLNAADQLDPRNDRLTWRADADSWYSDAAVRTSYTLDGAGRTTKVTYPMRAGSATPATDVFTYTTGTEAAPGGGTMPPGLPLSETNRLGGVTQHAYNAKGDRVRTTDPAGLITGYGYDALGRITSTSRSAVVSGSTVNYGTTTSTYNDASMPATTTEPGITNPITGVTHTTVTTRSYDAGGRLAQVSISDATGGDVTRTLRRGFDPAGRLTSTTTPDNATTSYAWNSAGDMVKETRPGGLVLEYRFDGRHNVVETAATGAGVDPMDANSTRLVLESRSYDPAGQLASVVDAMGRETAYTYFETGLVDTQKRVRRDGNGTITSSTLLSASEYDFAGNLVRVTTPGGAVRSREYDDAGFLIRDTIDPTGVAMRRSTTVVPAADGQPGEIRSGFGFAFTAGFSSEQDILFDAGGTTVDGGNGRYADNNAAFVYRFTLPTNATTATITLRLDNQFLVETSTDGTTWTQALKETNDIRNGSNQADRAINLTPLLAAGKTISVRVRDSIPTNGWGGRVTRGRVEYTRGSEPTSKTTNAYDTNGRLLSSTVDNTGGSPSSLVTRLTRDPRGLVTRMTDPANASTDFSYDLAGNPVTQTDPARTTWVNGTRTDNVQPVSTVGRDTFGEITDARQPDSTVTRTEYDPMGRPTRVTLPSYTPPGGTAVTPVFRTTYNVIGKADSETDPLGRIATHTYDKYGRLLSTTGPDPDGGGAQLAPVWRNAYDRVGELLETTDPTGARRLATYNDLGYQITSTDAERDGSSTLYYTTTLVPDDAGRITKITNALNSSTVFEYTTAGQFAKATGPTGQVVERRYDGRGLLIAEFIGGERATGYGYDPAGRQTTVSSHTLSNGVMSSPVRVFRPDYDAAGRPTTTTSGAGRTTGYTYDAGGNQIGVSQFTDPANPATIVAVELGYDALGRVTRMVDGNLNATNYTYNSLGLPESTVEPSTTAHPAAADRTWTTVYDAAGQPVRENLPGGVTQTRTFDQLGRVTQLAGAGAEGATSTRTIGYDLAGRVNRASNPAGELTYTWTDRGLLSRSTGPGGTATFAYDGAGNLTSRVDAAGTGTFTYNALGQLATAADPLTGRTVSYTYTGTGEPNTITYGGGGATRGYGYDNLGRLTSDTLKTPGGTTTSSVTYGYDNDDLPVTKAVTGLTGAGANTYGYDGLGRLTSWKRPDGQTVGYGYDKASNRTSVTSPAGTRTFTYDQRNRLLSASGAGEPALTRTWSARGTLKRNVLGTATTDYTFDAFEQLLTAGSTTYTYDALGRVGQRNGTAVLYADTTNAAVRTPNGLVFRGPGEEPISGRVTSGTARFLFADQHGDVVGGFDGATGTVPESRTYDPFGTASGAELALGFQGGWSDSATGLLNAHARWYDSAAGAFTSRDTWTLPADPVAQANRYGYGNGAPTAEQDPSGHCPDGCAIEYLLIAGLFLLLGAAVVLTQTNTLPDSAISDRLMAAMADAQMAALITAMRAAGYTLREIWEYIQSLRAGNATAARVNGQSNAPGINGTGAAGGIAAAAAAVIAAAIAAQIAAGATSGGATGAATTVGATPSVSVPAPAIGTTTTVLPPTVPILPDGATIGNIVNVAVPATVLAASDGSDASNAAAAGAGITAAGIAGTADPGGSDPNCRGKTPGEEARELIEEIANEVVDMGLDELVDLIPTVGKKNPAKSLRSLYEKADGTDPKYPTYIRDRILGHVIHDETFRRLQEWELENDEVGRFRYNRSRGADIYDTKTGTYIEITTEGEIGKHKARANKKTKYAHTYKDALYAIYCMPDRPWK